MEYSTQNDILQPILENGIEGFSEVLQKMLNLAMKLEREKVLKASPYQRTEERTGYALLQKSRNTVSFWHQRTFGGSRFSQNRLENI